MEADLEMSDAVLDLAETRRRREPQRAPLRANVAQQIAEWGRRYRAATGRDFADAEGWGAKLTGRPAADLAELSRALRSGTWTTVDPTRQLDTATLERLSTTATVENLAARSGVLSPSCAS